MCSVEGVWSSSAATTPDLCKPIHHHRWRRPRCTGLKTNTTRSEMTAKGINSLAMATGWWSMLPDGLMRERMGWRRREAKASLQNEDLNPNCTILDVFFAQLHTSRYAPLKNADLQVMSTAALSNLYARSGDERWNSLLIHPIVQALLPFIASHLHATDSESGIDLQAALASDQRQSRIQLIGCDTR